jgi:hypothetical protein
MLRVRRSVAVTFAVAVLGMPYALASGPGARDARQQDRPLCAEPLLPCPAKPVPVERDTSAYDGLGTWVDAYDFAREFGYARTRPSVVEDMAKQGVTTLYIQAAKDRDGVGDLVSPDLLGEFLERAHAHKMKVVAWYLPRFVDPNRDWRHVDAMLRFRSHGHAFDGIGLDIESRENGNLQQRNDRLVALSQRTRQAAGAMAVSAIVVPPVVTDVMNPKFWPEFPWTRLKPSYDVWIPMGYWTNRKPDSEYRDAYRYTMENVRLLRENVEDEYATVHVAGGVGTKATSRDYERFVKAAYDSSSVGLSCYDYATTARSAWPILRKGPA